MKLTKKFKINGIKEFLKELLEDENIFFKYGVLLGTSDTIYDKELVNNHANILNLLRKHNIKINKNKELSW